jgi:glycosyltransferase involved in cell wall biosynthesis
MTEAEELVSVIVPAYNSARFIGRTLQSIIAQSHRQIEVIVVDDGSTDDTSDVVSAYARKDERIYLFKRPHGGAPVARNFAAAQARGAFLAPCDSDDLWSREKIALQLAALRNAPAATGVAYCWSVGIDEKDAVIFPDWAHAVAEGNVLHAMIEDSLPGSGSAPLIRRSCFEAAGGYPEDVANADEWQLYIALAGICAFTPVRAHLVGYRFRAGNVSSNFSGIADSLGRTTDWIVATWPDMPREVLRRRAYTVNCYLSFLAVRQQSFVAALRYRLAAWTAQPTRACSLSTLGFLLVMLGQVVGVQRYYYRFWRRPVAWEGVESSWSDPKPPEDAPAH